MSVIRAIELLTLTGVVGEHEFLVAVRVLAALGSYRLLDLGGSSLVLNGIHNTTEFIDIDGHVYCVVL